MYGKTRKAAIGNGRCQKWSQSGGRLVIGSSLFTRFGNQNLDEESNGAYSGTSIS